MTMMKTTRRNPMTRDELLRAGLVEMQKIATAPLLKQIVELTNQRDGVQCRYDLAMKRARDLQLALDLGAQASAILRDESIAKSKRMLELAAALRKYSDHTAECEKLNADDPLTAACSCGYSAVIAGLGAMSEADWDATDVVKLMAQRVAVMQAAIDWRMKLGVTSQANAGRWDHIYRDDCPADIAAILDDSYKRVGPKSFNGDDA
jgi:hypothetical protein